ncbi:MAG: poly(3-hydroxyalkanoate) synthetase [Alphaproteobacteria bacterium CG11_big_fil_rev_8_21_14_0_20_39_49]|nr:MAG: poly(3-hydroxyalkanoate) synthetase [Alphaproteobacteria bacterium CG11_big_fil_rev_8_21_14_0_20_39_49]
MGLQKTSVSLVPANTGKEPEHITSPFGWWQDAWSYQIDTWQRSILFMDTLRQRAGNMMEHEKNGMPPLLDFKYELVMDARTFERPANYALLKITKVGDKCLEDCLDPNKPPVIIVDPRAGHGPGIGGFKRDSEVGIAMHEGYPVYFVMFYPEPMPHQSIADVLHALRKFVEEAKKLHSNKAPILYGNCQAGWMLTILAADCQGLVGPVVTNGSPLSYWANSEEGNPMQIMGSLSGGVWLARLFADLGNGELDGAWLVQNFEKLNPANTLWDKNYNLYSNIDTERERFLDFERWWNGYYRLSEEEITSTVANLFIGDKLERGELKLHEDCVVNLKNIKSPMLIFASEGDNITPPRQALHWIRQVYPATKDLKTAGQRIAYLINTHVGHLGIFVSAKVATLEHRAILEHISKLEAMKPGLYQMIIDNPTGNPDCRHDQYNVSFEERKIEDLCQSEPTTPFKKIREVSERNDQIYKATMRPWVQIFTNPLTAKVMRELHPMRFNKKIFSEQLNPFMWNVAWMAKIVSNNRLKAREDNVFEQAEHTASQQVAKFLDAYKENRDMILKGWFTALYDK